MTAPTPAEADVQATITRLFVYPIKSCAGVELRQAVLSDTGLDLDRHWMVVDREGVFVTQRELPRMALIRPTIRSHDIVLRAPGMLALHLEIDVVEEPTQARVWNDTVKAYDMGDLAAHWFSDFLAPARPGEGKREPPYRLVRFDPEQSRLSSRQWTGDIEAENQFADGFPILVISQASLDELNRKLVAAGHPAAAMERFRPNVVFAGGEAHDEDRIGDLSIITSGEKGPVRLRMVKPCARCPIPNIDPTTAQSDPAVSDTLQTYRSVATVGGAIAFGMNAVMVSGVGETLQVGQAASGDYRFD